MRVLVNRMYAFLDYDKIRQWSKLIAITGGAQMIVQLSAVIGGILIIRLLPTQEYALYTLSNTMLGTMIMLSDNGINSGVMAEAGKVWQDKKKLGNVLATGFQLRKKFAIYTLIITLPVLFFLLLKNHASWISILLIIIAIIPAFIASLSDALLEIAPKMHQEISSLQRNQIEVNVGRLVLSVALLFAFPFTFIALIANSIPRIYGNYKLRKISSNIIDDNGEPDAAIEKNVMVGVKRTLPIIIYHCISGQISIWLVSIFGSTTSIAQIGALGRLSMIFTLFSALFTTLVVPRFSRMAASHNLLRQFLLVQLVAIAAAFFLLTATWVFANQILWVLGEKYSNLHYELFLVCIVNSIGLVEGVCSQLVLSRGWFFNPYVLIAINFLSTIFFLFFLNTFSLVNILYFNIFTTLIFYSIGLIFGLVNIKLQKESL